MPVSRPTPSWTPSTAWGSAATGGCWPSTATRTGCTRSGWKTGRPWWRNSTGRRAGRTPPSSKSTPSRASYSSGSSRWSRPRRSAGGCSTSSAASGSPCSPSGADGRRSCRTPRRSNGWVASWGGFMPSGRSRRSATGPPSGSRASARSRATTSWPTDSSRPISPTRGRAWWSWRSTASGAATTGPAPSGRCASTATATRATCSGPTTAPISWISTTAGWGRRCRTCGCSSRGTARP